MTRRRVAGPRRWHRAGHRARRQYVADLQVADDAPRQARRRSTCARARIVAIDAERGARHARRAPRADGRRPARSPCRGSGRRTQDRPVLAVGETKYHGDAGGARRRETRRTQAEAAARLVRVEHEELPAVCTVAGALGRRRAAGPGPVAPARRSDSRTPTSSTSTASSGASIDAAGGTRRPRRRAPLHVPDGHPVRHRAARVHGRAGRRRRSSVWSDDPAPELAAAGDRRPRRACRCPRSAIYRARPGRRVRRQAAREVRAGGGVRGAQARPAGAARADASRRRSRPSAGPSCEIAGPHRVRREDGAIVFQDIDADYLIGAYTDIADRVVGKGSYPAPGRTTCPAVRIVARRVLSHTVPSTAFRGFGNPQINWAVESTLDEAARARWASTRSSSGSGTSPARGDRFIPFDTPCDGDWAENVRRAAELIGWGDPGAGRPRARDRRRASSRAPRPGSRTRSSGCWPTAPWSSTRAPRTWARARGRCSRRSRPGAGRAARLGHGRDGRHRGRAVRPADVGVAVDRADGQRRARGVPRHPGRSCARWRHGSTGSTRTRSSSTRASSAARRPRAADPRGARRRAGPARRRGHGPRRDAQGGGARPPARRAPAFFEFNCTGDRGVGRSRDRRRHDPPPRDRVATSARRSTRSRSGCRTRAPRSWASATR